MWHLDTIVELVSGGSDLPEMSDETRFKVFSPVRLDPVVRLSCASARRGGAFESALCTDTDRGDVGRIRNELILARSSASLPLSTTFIQPIPLDKVSTSSLDGLFPLIDTRLSPPVVCSFNDIISLVRLFLLDCDSVRRRNKRPSTVGEQDRAGGTSLRGGERVGNRVGRLLRSTVPHRSEPVTTRRRESFMVRALVIRNPSLTRNRSSR